MLGRHPSEDLGLVLVRPLRQRRRDCEDQVCYWSAGQAKTVRGGAALAQLARRTSPASHSNVATTSRACWCRLAPGGRPPPPTATSPRRIACATVSPSASCCPVAIDCSPRIG